MELTYKNKSIFGLEITKTFTTIDFVRCIKIFLSGLLLEKTQKSPLILFVQRDEKLHIKTCCRLLSMQGPHIDSLLIFNRDCKPINTFIVVLEGSVETICQGKNNQESAVLKGKFIKHVCTRVEEKDPKSCSYEETRKESNQIHVVCGKNEKPVHYGKSKARSG
uniref:Ribonuclease A-domain domain-containing protein n=1 Tax=Oryzias melastigma TaxID=30732 RepID=A0A3B3BWJ9_ORYME